MIRCNYLILSEGINLDQITGLSSVHNIIEKLSSSSFPFFINKIAILAFFERTKEDASRFEIRRELFNNSHSIKTDKVSVDFNDRLKHKRINIFQGVEIKEPGDLRLSIYHGGKEINRYVIEIEKV